VSQSAGITPTYSPGLVRQGCWTVTSDRHWHLPIWSQPGLLCPSVTCSLNNSFIYHTRNAWQSSV